MNSIDPAVLDKLLSSNLTKNQKSAIYQDYLNTIRSENQIALSNSQLQIEREKKAQLKQEIELSRTEGQREYLKYAIATNQQGLISKVDSLLLTHPVIEAEEV